MCCMERLTSWIPTMWDCKDKTLPRIRSEYGDGFGESYSSHYEKESLHIKAQGPRAAAYAYGQLMAAAKSGHMGEYVGASAPRYPLRPLWLCGTERRRLTSRATIMVPEGLITDCLKNIHALCKQVIRCGYNALIIGGIEEQGRAGAPLELSSALALIKSYGITVIIKADLLLEENCPSCEGYAASLEGGVTDVLSMTKDADMILWRSRYRDEDFIADGESTVYDNMRREVHAIETILSGKARLIYYVPYDTTFDDSWQSTWLHDLCDDVASTTTIAFPAFAGSVCGEKDDAHPVWDALRVTRHSTTTQLLPIVNIGKVGRGEGLWPDLSCGLIEEVIGGMHRHSFGGIIAMTRILPRENGFLGAALWIAGQRMWRDIPAERLAATWFAAYRPDIDYNKIKHAFNDIEGIVRALYVLRSSSAECNGGAEGKELMRLDIDIILSRLSALQKRYSIERDDIKMTTFEDYIRYFVRDIRRIVLDIVTRSAIPVAGILSGDDMSRSFWTAIEGGTSGGMAGATKAILLAAPYPGAPGSRQELVYKENRTW